MSKRFVILDRDGTIIDEVHYLSRPEQVQLLSGVVEGLQKMRRMGWGLIIATNQSGIGRGHYTEADLSLVHQRLLELLEPGGILFDGIYHCPHTPDDHCHCRKPKTGMIEAAARDLDFNPTDSIVIGDKPCDMALGKNIGAKTILVRTGYAGSYQNAVSTAHDHEADTLLEAADIIASPFMQSSSGA